MRLWRSKRLHSQVSRDNRRFAESISAQLSARWQKHRQQQLYPDKFPGRPMKVYDAVANAFIKEGTTTLFGLLGDGQMTWWSSIAKHPGLKIVDVRDEGSAVSMAEG